MTVPAPESLRALRELIRRVVDDVRPGSADARDDEQFVALGLSSLDAVQVARRLSVELHREVAATSLWDHPTIASLAGALAGPEPQAPHWGDVGSARDSGAGAAAPEPVAIVGIGCRFPGAAGPAQYFDLLVRGSDPVTEVPTDRWDVDRFYDSDASTPGASVSRWGGFLTDLDAFDAAFFGMSPREAAQLDPRQRLALECAWEALEDAGIPADALAGTRTGVFMAALASNYGSLVFDQHLEIVDAYSGTGNANSALANRLSFTWDLQGPSVALDTACSGSLVAVHLASRALLAGDCDVVLAGGVNVILKPDETIFFSKTGALSPDGQCRVFDARANGIVRSEGCGIVVLKRLSDAQRAGDRIHAVLLASAVNQDGASNGLMAPSGLAQERLLTEVYRQARVDPAEVQYVEAHGTGTALGDPIEVGALAAVLGSGRPPERRLALGSAKSNLGHTEAAAGMAGLIKVVLAMEHGQLPGNLHFTEPNPLLQLDRRPIRIVADTQPWPDAGPGLRRLAGVSAFGFAGTNAHVVVAGAPPTEQRRRDRRTADAPALLALSARSPAALRDLADRYADALEGRTREEATALVRAAVTGRMHHEWRLAVAADPQALAPALARFVADGTAPGAHTGRRPHAGSPPLAWLFSGQGSHWPGMGRRLLGEQPFRAVLEDCEQVVAAWSGRSLLAELAAPPARSRLDRTAIGQPAVVAVQLGLTALWRHWGIAPDVVVGQSLGEIAAAVAAGALDVTDAMTIACARADAMAKVEGTGSTVAVGLAAADAAGLARGAGVRVAGRLSDALTLMSGPVAEMAEVVAHCEARGVFARALPGVGVALHGVGLEAVADEFAAAIADLRPRRPEVPLVLASTAAAGAADLLDAAYWVRSMCDPFDLVAALDELTGHGIGEVLEVSPHPMLRSAVADAGLRAGAPMRHLASLARDRDERLTLLDTLGQLYCAGAHVRWPDVVGGRGPIRDLPHYPWQRERHWFDQLVTGSTARDVGDSAGGHPLLGAELDLADWAGARAWHRRLDPARLPLLAHHRVHGQPVLPGAAVIELMLAAAREVRPAAPASLADVEFLAALPLTGGPTVQVSVRLGDPAVVEVASRAEPDAPWVVVARGRLASGGDGSAEDPENHLNESQPTDRPTDRPGGSASLVTAARDLAAAPSRPVPGNGSGPPEAASGVAELYTSLAAIGLEYSGPFRAVEQVHRDDAGVEAVVRVATGGRWVAHPAALDGCLQAVAALSTTDDATLRLPRRVERVSLTSPLPDTLHVRVRPRGAVDGPRLVADLELSDAAGVRVGTISGASFDAVGAAAGTDPLADWFLTVQWVPQPRTDRLDLPAPSAALAGFTTQAADLAERLGLARFSPNAAFAELVSALCRDAVATVGEAPIPPTQQRLWARVRDLAGGASQRPVDDVLADVRAAHPDAGLEIAVLDRSGRALPSILTGELDASDLLFGTDGGELLARFYGESLWMRYCNAALADAVAAAARDASPGRPLRVLEVGAGTGATTAHLLAALPADDVEYVATDLSPALVATLADRFAADPRLDTRVLDVEGQPPADLRGTFDVVVAANVLHATVDLAAAVRNALACLRPGGLLLALEGDGPQPWLDLVVGGTEGWWRGTDDRRAGYPLIRRADWAALLMEVGCETVAFAATPGADPPQLVVVAQLPHPAMQRRWLVVGSGDPLDDRLVAALRSSGEKADTCTADELPDALAEGTVPVHVVGTSALRATPWPQLSAQALIADEERTGWAAVRLAQDVVASGRPSRIHLVTRGAQAVGPSPPTGLGQAAVWGVGRVIAAELPELWGGLVDSDPDADPDAAAEALAAELVADGPADQVALRGSERLVARLHRHALPSGPEVQLRPDATYLVTGGLRGIGHEVAASLVEHGARHLLVLARTRLPDRSTWGALPEDHPHAAQVAGVLALERRGASVTVGCADVSDPDSLRAALTAHADALRPPLRGVIHAAGLIDDALVTRMTRQQFADVARVKAVGGWNLHEQLGDGLDLFVLFSSGTSLLGTFGQANYAAGNAVMDLLAHARAARGLPATSVNWGVWSEVGIVARRGSAAALAQNGLIPIPTDLGLAAFHRIVAAGPAQIAALPTDWTVWRQLYPAGTEQPLFADLVAEWEQPDAPAEPRGDLLELRTLPAGAARDAAADAVVRAVLGRAMRRPPDSVDLDAPLTGLGLDSIMAVEIRNAVAGAGGPTVSIVDLLAGMTGRALVARVAAGDASGQAPTRPGEAAATTEAGFPATPGQEALWLAEQAGSVAPGTYAVPVAARLRAVLDAELLARALAEVLRRHDVLRARFQPSAGGLRLVVDPPGPASLDVVTDPLDVEAELRRFATEPFDLARGPLCRFLLVQAGDESTFALSIHHAVFDGWSAGILVADLAEIYERLAAGRSLDDLPDAPQFADHALWVATPEQHRIREADVAHLVARLERHWVAEVLELDYPRPLRPTYRGAKWPVTLPSAVVAAVDETARTCRTTPFCVLLAALAATLREHAAGDVVVASTPSSRPSEEAAGMIGYFVDTVLIPLSVDRTEAFADLVAQAHAALLDTFDHASAPLDDVLARLAERVPGTPRVQVVLTLQNSPAATSALVDSVRTIDNGTAKFDLVLNLTQTAHGIDGWFEYASDVLRRASVERLAERFVATLAAGCARPDAPVQREGSLL